MKLTKKANDIILSYMKCTALNGSCSVSDIAGQLGLSKSGLYNYFSGMQDLRMKAFLYCDEIVNEKFPNVNFKEPDIVEMLGKLVFDVCDVLNEEPVCFYFSIIVSSCRYDRVSLEKLNSIESMFLARVRVALEYAVQESWILPCNTDTAASVFTNSLMNVISLCSFNSFPLESIRDSIEDFVSLLNTNVRS